MAVLLDALPTRALALTERALYTGVTHSLDERLDLEDQLQREAAATRDHREGVAAFLAERPAAFEGR